MSVEAPERDPHADRHYIEIRCRGTVEALALDADRLVVGRHRSNGVVLDDKAVSRVHAVLERSNGVWFICDLGSHNGTFVNGKRILQERPLFRDDQIRLGETLITFCGPGAGDQTRDLEKVSSSPAAERTFMFTDVVESTELVGLIGDEAWQDLVDWHNRTLREAFLSHGGEEVDSAGDGFFVVFPDALSAAGCAVAILRTLAQHRREHGFAPRVRVGLHSAIAIHSSEGYRGKAVHLAARIAALAGADEILASGDTTAHLGDHFAFSPSRSVQLKGVSAEVLVASLAWR